MPDFTVSPVTQNHQTAVGKGIWHKEQVTSARGVWKMRTTLRIRIGLFLLFYRTERRMQILVILVGTSFSGWLICQMVSAAQIKGASQTPWAGDEEVRAKTSK